MVMYFKYVIPITRRKVTDITSKKLAVGAVQKMAAGNKSMHPIFLNKAGVLLHPNDFLSGVDYEDKN